MYKNQANLETTNIFKSLIGALNMAPIKISGQYKIIVKLDKTLWLDDYTGRQIQINTEFSFLEQLSDFLKTPTEIDNTIKIRYGGFQDSTSKYYHIPIYFSEKQYYPEYFVLTKSLNETITDPKYLYNSSEILENISLESIGLYDIFDEINLLKLGAPVNFDLENSRIDISGYSLENNCLAKVSFDLSNFQANQPYLDVLNNKILNTFANNNIIYPYFINIEFEFDYVDNYKLFENFFGYFGNGIEYVDETILTSTEKDNLFVSIKQTEESFEWEQFYPKTQEYIQSEYNMPIARISTFPISNYSPQIRYEINNIRITDKIQIFDSENELRLDYTVTKSDIQATLRETILLICDNIMAQSTNSYLCEINSDIDILILKITINEIDIFSQYSYMVVPNHFILLDTIDTITTGNIFYGITDYDIQLSDQLSTINNIENLSNLNINDIIYPIDRIFKFNDKIIVRLQDKPNISDNNICTIYETKLSKLLLLSPIPFLKYVSDVYSYNQYDGDSYCDELISLFGENVDDPGVLSEIQTLSKTTIEEFKTSIISQNNQYVIDGETELVDTNELNVTDNNSVKVLTMMFNSLGQTSYLTPSILNIDKRFYIQNGNIDSSLLSDDYLRFNWFLIKGKCPNYLKNDIRGLRYFDGPISVNPPKITSKLVRITDDYCETIFLGVKYQLPIKYVGFNFAVYLDFNNLLYKNTKYFYETDYNNNAIYLSVNNYLDFVDLLRGGTIDNEPLIDLSFFYNITKSYNTKSDNIDSYQNIGLSICNNLQTYPTIMGETPTNWYHKINTKYYILINRYTVGFGQNNFEEAFKPMTSPKQIIYNKILIDDIVYYQVFAEVTIKNIHTVSADYLWCEDLIIDLYNDKNIFLFNTVTGKLNQYSIEEINNADVEVVGSTKFGDFNKILTINNQSFESFGIEINDDNTNRFSIKSHYFEIENKTTSIDGVLTANKSLFYLADDNSNIFYLKDKSDQEIFDMFDSSNAIIDYTITIFDRMNLFVIVKELLKTNLKYREFSADQIKKLVNNLLLINLKDYTEINHIQIKNTDEYVNTNILAIDKNICIWSIMEEKRLILINRHKGKYYPYLPISDNEITFQLAENNKNDSLHNIYDENFYEEGVGATGLWNEVQGNILSSLFTYNEQIEILTSITSNEIDCEGLLKDYFDIELMTILNKNTNYISNIDTNIDDYIKQKFVKYLLNNFYELSSVLNSNKRIKYQNLSDNKIHITEEFNNVPTLKLIFNRI